MDEKVKINLQENELAYELSFLVDTANFDALGFIGKKYGEKEIDRFSRNIIQGVTDGIRKVMGKDENWSMESWNEQKLEDSINRQLKEIMGDNEMIFPFYNLDLSYNVLKHARDISMKREGIIEAEDIYAAMQKAYGYIAMELYEEDRRYDQYGITRHEMTPNSGEHEKWSMRFINSPFITRFGILYPEEMRERHKEDQREKLIDADVYCFDKSNKAETSNYAGALKNLVSSIRVPDINEAPDDNRDEEAW